MRGPTLKRPSFAYVVGRMTGVNAVVLCLSFVTAPLNARALGPGGRGELAAILVPFFFIPVLTTLGLNAFTLRHAARGTPLNALVGSVGVILLATSAIGAALAFPVADLVSGGRETVHRFVVISMFLLPFTTLAVFLLALANGLEEWHRVIAIRLIAPVGGLVGVVVLYITDALTVASSATVMIAMGLAQILPGLALLRRAGRPCIDRALVREALSFGPKATVGTTSARTNARLDQLLMTRLVPSGELGLYAVAVNVASATGAFTSALVVPLAVRVAKGDAAVAARALRVTIWGIGAVNGLIAAAVPLLMPLVFGAAFRDAVPMTVVLLAAGVLIAAVSILSASLSAAGYPGAGALAQVVTLAVTVPGLLIALPVLGGLGAAIVTLASTVVAFTFVLSAAKRRLGLRWRELLLPTRADGRWAVRLIPPRVRRRLALA